MGKYSSRGGNGNNRENRDPTGKQQYIDGSYSPREAVAILDIMGVGARAPAKDVTYDTLRRAAVEKGGKTERALLWAIYDYYKGPETKTARVKKKRPVSGDKRHKGGYNNPMYTPGQAVDIATIAFGSEARVMVPKGSRLSYTDLGRYLQKEAERLGLPFGDEVIPEAVKAYFNMRPDTSKKQTGYSRRTVYGLGASTLAAAVLAAFFALRGPSASELERLTQEKDAATAQAAQYREDAAKVHSLEEELVRLKEEGNGNRNKAKAAEQDAAILENNYADLQNKIKKLEERLAAAVDPETHAKLQEDYKTTQEQLEEALAKIKQYENMAKAAQGLLGGGNKLPEGFPKPPGSD